jgi:hypothetical protein
MLWTDIFAGTPNLTAENRADMIIAMIEAGTFDMRTGSFDVADITEDVVMMVDAVDLRAMADN